MNQSEQMFAVQDSTLSYAIWGNPPSLNTVVALYSETLLVTLPTPDFSMPYNVICLGQWIAFLIVLLIFINMDSERKSS